MPRRIVVLHQGWWVLVRQRYENEIKTITSQKDDNFILVKLYSTKVYVYKNIIHPRCAGNEICHNDMVAYVIGGKSLTFPI